MIFKHQNITNEQFGNFSTSSNILELFRFRARSLNGCIFVSRCFLYFIHKKLFFFKSVVIILERFLLAGANENVIEQKEKSKFS